MLFDEVTSALDPEFVGEVLTVMRDLARTRHDDGRRHPRDVVRAGSGRPSGLPRRRGIVEEGVPAAILDSPQGEAHTAVPASLAPARAFARGVVNGRSSNRGRSTRMKRILLATVGVAILAVVTATVGVAKTAETERDRAGGGGAAEAACGDREPEAVHRRGQVRHAAVRLPRRPGQERRRRRGDREVVRPLRVRPRAAPDVRLRPDGPARAAAHERAGRPRHLHVHVHGRPRHADRLLAGLLQGHRPAAREEQLVDLRRSPTSAARRSRPRAARSTTAG